MKLEAQEDAVSIKRQPRNTLIDGQDLSAPGQHLIKAFQVLNISHWTSNSQQDYSRCSSIQFDRSPDTNLSCTPPLRLSSYAAVRRFSFSATCRMTRPYEMGKVHYATCQFALDLHPPGCRAARAQEAYLTMFFISFPCLAMRYLSGCAVIMHICHHIKASFSLRRARPFSTTFLFGVSHNNSGPENQFTWELPVRWPSRRRIPWHSSFGDLRP
ncbi:hypothetical protein B0H17DRAFT_225683 [Mycena rosella]|uniref:Uncharacterized protein n=1 Tax=Mycena rosella TaxID=1033263 RepID=A0AAD7CWN7_MYCRO|nr:hypothetical protein B0H17DRAFT_225683 [Mycena rosella]